VAIVSISRIQVRRGRKNQGTGLPQLASGEFGWAIDAQELYIGNGSVAEGSPSVGNTRVLTEKDNIFELASGYQYKKQNSNIQTGLNENVPVIRSLQDRLDDRVSIRSFGADGDGSDQTQEIQQAIYTLFLNPASKTNPKSRVILWFEPGLYKISSKIYLPPYVNIQGAGPEKTVIKYTGSDVLFETVNSQFGTQPPIQDTTDNQSRYNSISGLTIETENTSIVFRLVNCRDSKFSNLKLLGSAWSNSSANFDVDKAFELINLSTAVTCHSNKFDDIEFEGFSFGIVAAGDIRDNTWNNCKFRKNKNSIVFGQDSSIGSSTLGKTVGPTNNFVKNSIFDEIYETAFLIENGKYNASIDNRYYNVGNEGGTSGNATHPVVQFEDDTNISNGDWFKRTAELGYDQEFIINKPYIAEVSSNAFTDFKYTNKLSLGEIQDTPQQGAQRFFKLPIDRVTGYEIEYLYTSKVENAARQGTMNLIANPNSQQHQLTDDYEYAGNPAWAESLKFSAEIFDENSDGIVDTVAIMAVNSLVNDDADFYYRVKIK
jgi:hypothetical protein